MRGLPPRPPPTGNASSRGHPPPKRGYCPPEPRLQPGPGSNPKKYRPANPAVGRSVGAGSSRPPAPPSLQPLSNRPPPPSSSSRGHDQRRWVKSEPLGDGQAPFNFLREDVRSNHPGHLLARTLTGCTSQPVPLHSFPPDLRPRPWSGLSPLHLLPRWPLCLPLAGHRRDSRSTLSSEGPASVPHRTRSLSGPPLSAQEPPRPSSFIGSRTRTSRCEV